MTPLRVPVKSALRATTTAASVTRMWGRIEARSRSRAGAPVSRGRMALLVAAAILLAIVGLAGAWPRQGTSVASPPGPVLQADGDVVHPIRVDRDDHRLALSDGTVITLSAGTSLEPLNNSEDTVVLKQGVGRGRYDIAPGGPRRWTIECGQATIEVVGTSFEIEKRDRGVHVDVTRGVVLVRGEAVPDRVVRLTAGMSIDVPGGPLGPARSVHEGAVEAAQPPVAESAPSLAAPGAPRAPVARAWRKLAAQGEHEKAYTALGGGGIAVEARSAPVDDLFALADVARLSGHPGEAVEPLRRILADHAGDARTSLAALTLGRVQVRSLAMPDAAARSLQMAMTLGIPSGLSEDAHALLIEARSTAGDRAGARAAYARFRLLFPESARTSELRRWLVEP